MESFDDVINSPSQQFRVSLWRHKMSYSEYLQMARDCILDSIASVDGDLPDYQLAILRGVWETLDIMAD